MRKRLWVLGLVGLLALALAAPPSAARPKSEVHEVIMGGGPIAVLWNFTPDDLTISKGDRVAWSNPTSTLHHVTFYEGPADDTLHVPSGGAEVERFKKRGTYLYRCDIEQHSLLVGGECLGMCGRLVVE